MFRAYYTALVLALTLSSTAFAIGPDWIGKPAPNFKLKTVDGRATLSLSDLRGYVVIVDFWASWCTPCRHSLPLLSLLESGEKKVKVIAISVDDDRENAVDFLKRLRVKLIALHDEEKHVAEEYSIPMMPSALILDKKGIVQFVHAGYTESDMDDFQKEVEGLE
jgi:thiol-disulfide isomerase/thioredoxin